MPENSRPTVCGNCRFFVLKPVDPKNLRNRMGECRHSPPGVTVLPNGVTATAYPTIQPQFAACAQFAPPAIEGIDRG